MADEVNLDPRRLRYRRQFLLTRVPVITLEDWAQRPVGDFILQSHPDLEVHALSNNDKTVILIGYLYDAIDHQKGNLELLADIVQRTDSFDSFLQHIKRYAGRYVFIYRDSHCFKLLHDPLSLREVFYCSETNNIVCGSQPNVVAAFSRPVLTPTREVEALDFYTRHMPSVRQGWVGDGTYYDGIRHLLPNHCLNLRTMTAERYWPNTDLKRLTLDQAVDRACAYAQGMLRAAAHRQRIMMAVTSGTDSRSLLAASRDIQDQVYYFVNMDPHLTDRSPDVTVPTSMFRRIGVPFQVHAVAKEIAPDFRASFRNNVFFASERILATIYNVWFRQHRDKVNILGIGEIGRSRLGKAPRRPAPYYLAYMLGYKRSKFAVDQCARWLEDGGPIAARYGINVMTLLYWEQLLGNWGPVGNSESDIAIEEFDPYDSHYFYETLLSVDERIVLGNRSVIFHAMIGKMWPELLAFPFNPPGRLGTFLQKVGYTTLKKELMYHWHHLQYLRVNGRGGTGDRLSPSS